MKHEATISPKRPPLRKTRGRPKKHDQERENAPDLGTPELILKRACQVTTEPIDLCLQRGIITQAQHRSALHFRWLHTVRYGAPGVTALDLSRGDGHDITREDAPEWRLQREAEYSEAIHLLKQHRRERDLIPCIIYNEPPLFLQRSALEGGFRSSQKAERIQQLAIRFADGLELLHQHWKKRH